MALTLSGVVMATRETTWDAFTPQGSTDQVPAGSALDLFLATDPATVVVARVPQRVARANQLTAESFGVGEKVELIVSGDVKRTQVQRFTVQGCC